MINFMPRKREQTKHLQNVFTMQHPGTSQNYRKAYKARVITVIFIHSKYFRAFLVAQAVESAYGTGGLGLESLGQEDLWRGRE